MDPEIEMKKLSDELDCLDAAIDSLKSLKRRKYCKNCLNELSDLVEKLKARKKAVKASLDDITNELVAIAEVYKDLDFSELDDNLQ